MMTCPCDILPSLNIISLCDNIEYFIILQDICKHISLSLCITLTICPSLLDIIPVACAVVIDLSSQKPLKISHHRDAKLSAISQSMRHPPSLTLFLSCPLCFPSFSSLSFFYLPSSRPTEDLRLVFLILLGCFVQANI